MRLRPYNAEFDFDRIKGWINDERSHAMWCGNRFNFPIERENFDAVLREHFLSLLSKLEPPAICFRPIFNAFISTYCVWVLVVFT